MSNLIQRSPEWHQMRRNKIGSSDAPVIMEVSPWTTPYQLWEEKIMGEKHIPKNPFEAAIKDRGQTLEKIALDKFCELTGLLMVPDVVFHPKHEWMMASLDAIDVEKKNIVEIKCPGELDQATALAGQVPEKYFPQLQHQLEVCQIEKAYYFSFDGTNGVLLEIYRDEKYIKKLISKEREFWEKLQDLIPPDLTSKDYLEHTDSEWQKYASEWLQINEQLKAFEKKEKELRETLVSLCDNQSSIGSGIKVSKIIRKGNIEYSKIPEIKNLNLEKYRKDPVEFWKIISI